MSITIQGGMAKGFPLAVPDPKGARPTSALLKRKFFDSRQRFAGVRFYDLCAGSGSIGLEALSRGADYALFVEASNSIFKTLQKNVKNLENSYELAGKSELVKTDILKWFKSYSSEGRKNVVFFDPPYEQTNLYQKFFKILMSKNKESLADTTFVVEFCRQKTAPETEFQSWFRKPDKSYRQGTSFLYIYEF